LASEVLSTEARIYHHIVLRHSVEQIFIFLAPMALEI